MYLMFSVCWYFLYLLSSFLCCSDHLKIHKKTHDTQKPYQCSVCNRGYNTAAALTAHMQNHKAKLTAHALNQLLKDAQAPGESHALTQLLRDTAVDTNSQALNHFLKDTQKVSLNQVVLKLSMPFAIVFFLLMKVIKKFFSKE